MRGQRRAILQVSKVIDIDERDDGLAMLGDRDGTVGVPGLGDKFPEVRPSRSQRITGHTSKFTLCGVVHADVSVTGRVADRRGAALDDPAIGSIAERAGKTPAQVVLRWHIQRGDIVFQSRSHRGFDIFGFELSDRDVAEISALNKNERTGPDPDTFTGGA